MERFFAHRPDIPRFATFSEVHIITLLVLTIIGAALLFYSKNMIREAPGNRFRFSLAALIILLELSEHSWRIYMSAWSPGNSLPLNLCRIGSFITAAMLVSGNQRLFELSYFWSLGGAVNALITPTLSRYGFPHFLFFKFFIAHGLLIFSVLYFILAEHRRPSWNAVGRVLVITHVYAAFVGVINCFTGGNYLYLCRNPGKSTILSFLGDWPYYLAPLWLITVLSIIILYLPFYLHDRFNHGSPAGET